MPIPESLETLLTIMLARLNRHPQNALLPHHRWTIYQALASDGVLYGGRIGWLAAITARRVLSIWIKAQPGVTLPGEMIYVSESVLKGAMTVEQAQAEWEQGAGVLGVGAEELDGNEWLKDQSLTSVFAGRACLYTIRETIGPHPFENSQVALREDTTDGDISPEHMDVAGWAATAASWPVWIDAPDDYDLMVTHLEERREFWMWWLNDAITQAWERAG